MMQSNYIIQYLHSINLYQLSTFAGVAMYTYNSTEIIQQLVNILNVNNNNISTLHSNILTNIDKLDLLYDKSNKLNTGEYGIIYLTYSNANVVKKIFDFSSGIIELAILSKLQYKINIIHLIKYVLCPSIELVLPRIYNNLSIWKLEHKFNDEKIKNIIYQLINGYVILYNNKILHRDIKPPNILYEPSISQIYYTDFGISTFSTSPYLEWNVQTLDFSAPEIILKKIKITTLDIHPNETQQYFTKFQSLYQDTVLKINQIPKYNYKIDIWSIGMTILRSLGNVEFKHIIQSYSMLSNSHSSDLAVGFLLGLLTLIPFESLGTSLTETICNNIILTYDNYKHKSLSFDSTYPYLTSNVLLRDLLMQMLCIDPDKRISLQDIIKHPYFDTYTGEQCLSEFERITSNDIWITESNVFNTFHLQSIYINIRYEMILEVIKWLYTITNDTEFYNICYLFWYVLSINTTICINTIDDLKLIISSCYLLCKCIYDSSTFTTFISHIQHIRELLNNVHCVSYIKKTCENIMLIVNSKIFIMTPYDYLEYFCLEYNINLSECETILKFMLLYCDDIFSIPPLTISLFILQLFIHPLPKIHSLSIEETINILNKIIVIEQIVIEQIENKRSHEFIIMTTTKILQ